MSNVTLVDNVLQEGLSKLEFYGDLVYKFRKLVDKNDFSLHLKRLLQKEISFNMNTLPQTAYMFVHPNYCW